MIGFIACAVMFIDFEILGLRFWIASGVFALAIIMIAVSEHVRLRRFRCPSCGERLRKPDLTKLSVGDAIVFECERCDVEWDTGLSIPDGS